ncbi:MAG TPA: 4Fe-4S dicluster domain-containing protein [Oxalicibacterium sp.]|nr:4Fe-4S dicluster domain-containing protein [Oxalicibacterium sp.]
MNERAIIPIHRHDDAHPHAHPHPHPNAHEPDSAERRRFLKIMAASMALAGAGCSGPPQEKIVPYVDMPERLVPGLPLFYASAFVNGGYAQGVLVESNMGRPTKIEGNPQHPASLGATDIFAQASILQLWDPDRSKTVYGAGRLSTWPAFEDALRAPRARWMENGGAGLRILTGAVTSPTFAAQWQKLQAQYPHARWHRYEALHDDRALDAARLAFGRPVDTLLHLDRAAVVLSLDAELFAGAPASVRQAQDFFAGRRANAAEFGTRRLYAVSATPSLTSAIADEQLVLPPQEIERLAWRLAARLGMADMAHANSGIPNDLSAKWESALAAALSRQRGSALIVAGGSISVQTRALVHAMNAHLGSQGKTVSYIAPVEIDPRNHRDSIAALSADMRDGKVDGLFILGGNPAYDAPADTDFAAALRALPFSAHLGLYRDETARLAAWHLPQTHNYEQWSDARAFDGTASIVQPLIAPLYQGRSMHEVLALLMPDGERNGHLLVQQTWRRHRAAQADFDGFWQQALMQGVVPDSAYHEIDPGTPRLASPPELAALPPGALSLLLLPDASLADGAFANNSWLQELPRPFSKLVWDNAALLSAHTAQAFGLENGDVVRIRLDDRAVEAPVWIADDHADNVVALPLGYGRRAAGKVGNGVGFDAYPLRTAASANGIVAVQLEKTGKRHTLVVRQPYMGTEGRDIVRTMSVAQYRRNPRGDHAPEPAADETLYPQFRYDDYKWGMAIDLNACIGCNACTIACQAENNIPVVGKEEVARGREMHWIRVDRYRVPVDGDRKKGKRTVFQPVPCMHCENAPCEEVCPVGATVHDSEGLNVQVYNRCVGTRFCSNNCPYKVRRFNFLQYSDDKVTTLIAQKNPDVTVRRRGVMEKCSSCLQRITRARIAAEKEQRRVRDGEVVTACEAVCPTRAIVFGDLNDAASRVNRAKASPLDYHLLAELNTRPRTSYAARVVNDDPELA